MKSEDDFQAKKWEKSAHLLARAESSLAGGVSSPFRRKFPVPLYFRDAAGCRMEDVDGNRYIDYTLGWGPLILGHRHPTLLEALRAQIERPHLYGAQHDLEYRVAEKIQSLVPCAERVTFTSSGSEAVQIALRLARSHTGRRLVVKFEGHYHGWMDTALVSYHPGRAEMGAEEHPNPVPGSHGQPPAALEDMLVCTWNRADLLEQLFENHSSEIAAVIMEPVLCNSGCLVPNEDYLQVVREVCTRFGAVLIFDEVITGFRVSLGGAQALYDVTPDMAVFGKALAGGLPLSAVAGRREILEKLTAGVTFGGTFNGNPLSLAAAAATLGELERNDGQLLKHADTMGKKLMRDLGELAGKQSVPLKIVGLGTAFGLHFTDREQLLDYRHTLDDDLVARDQFIKLSLEEGVYLLPDGRWYVSTVHQEEDVAETLQAVKRVFERMS